MKTNARLAKTMRIVLFALLVVVLSASAAFAWYFTASTLSMGQVGGSVNYLAKYFESGDGTSATQFAGSGLELDTGCAFEIANPDQFYNLAWLQYLGYFNEADEETGEVATTYFYLSADLDMTGYTLPPIGTSANPFLGNFDGNGHTVSNLTVANVTEAQLASGTFLSNDDLPLEVRVKQESEVSDVQIIGLFGVVGSLPGDSGYTYATATNQVKNVTVTGLTVETQTDTALIGLAAGYVNGTLLNVRIADSTITIADGTGAVDATNLTSNMSDYSIVGYCTDAYKVMVKQDEAVTSRYFVATVPQLVNQAMDAMQSGQDAAWGGSIDMESLYTRLLAKWNAATRQTYVSAETRTVDVNGNSTTTRTTNTNGEYKNAAWDGTGQYSFSLHTTTNLSQYLYLTGEDTVDPGKTVTATYTYSGYYIYNNGYYLNATANGVSASTTRSTLWIIDESDHTVYCWINNTKYYLRYDGTTLSVSTTQSTRWDFNTTDNCLYYNESDYALHYAGQWIVTNTASGNDESYFYINVGGRYLSATGINTTPTLVADKNDNAKWQLLNNYIVRNGTTTNYLRYNDGVYVSNSTTSAFQFSTSGNNTYLRTTYTSWGRTYYAFIRNNNNILDVSTNRNENTARNNATAVTLEYDTITYESKSLTRTAGTGTYTLTTNESSTYSAIPTFFPINVNDQGAASDSNTGYIVSGSSFHHANYPNQSGDIRVSYYNKSDNIGGSLSGSGTNTTISTIYTQTTSGFHRITDAGEFKNYSRVKDFMEDQFAGTNVYGLHFMDARIGTSTVTIPTASINGEEYANYPVPSDCIDFNLKDAGYITFMAGTYFPGNTAFFSLYKIDRDETTNAINSIKEISSIYGDPNSVNSDYVYVYSDGSSSGSTAGMNLLFDLSWITNPSVNLSSGTYYQKLFYYEIPVNKGEYALGSVANHDGAYLLYLDIGANGRITSKYAWIATTEDDVLVENRVNRFGVPAGVDFAPVGTVGDADATVALTGSGSAVFSRASDTITGTTGNALTQTLTFLRDDAEANASYVKNGATLTESEVTLDTYSETDYLDAPTNSVPAFDTYGVEHQLITKTLTVRLYDQGAIDDAFTITYSYEKDGILEDADDPLTISYTDPLIYMIQYDSSKVTSAPTLVGGAAAAGFKGTIYIGAAGEDSTLTQLYPAGTKTIVPSDKVHFQVYGHDTLFRVNGDPNTAITADYSSVLNETTGEQAFTYNVSGASLEEPVPVADGVATTSSGATAATLTYTLAAPLEDGQTANRLNALNTLNTLHTLNPLNAGKPSQSLSPLSAGKPGVTGLAPIGQTIQTVDGEKTDAPDADVAEEVPEEGGSADGTYVEPTGGWTTPVQVVTNGSRSERSDDEHVTRYYEFFPEDPAADEDGWILVLEIYDEGYEPAVPVYEPEFDPETGYEIDPETGWLIDPDSGWLIDPETGYLVDPETGGLVDRKTGWTVDPETGWLIDPESGEPVDPATLENTENTEGEPGEEGAEGGETTVSEDATQPDEGSDDVETTVSGEETGDGETSVTGDETDPAEDPDETNGGDEALSGETPAAGNTAEATGESEALSGETPAAGDATEPTGGEAGGASEEPPEEPPTELPEEPLETATVSGTETDPAQVIDPEA